MSRAATWDDVDADLEMIQRDATFRALDGPLRVLERVRGNLAELRHVQGESEPRRDDGVWTYHDVPVPHSNNRPETEIQTDQTSHTLGNQKTKPGMDNVTMAKAKGFTGVPCEQCGSLDTVRAGTCLRCTRCLFEGACG